MNKSDLKHVHLKHRLGVVFMISDLAFLIVLFFESGLIRETKIGLALFFWAWSTLLLPIPLATGLSLRKALRFFVFSFPLFFLFGLIVLTLPAQLVFRVISILAIIWVLVLSFLMKRKPEVFDLKPRINPLMFLESIIIFGLAFLCSYLIMSLKLMDEIIPSLSFYTNYFILGFMLYFAFSVMTIILRFSRKC